MKNQRSPTGIALRQYAEAKRAAGGLAATPHRVAEPAPRRPGQIAVHGAREHNLCNIDVNIPREKFTVITGVSGSGKSTLAFDILFNEGQRRYLESLNAYARQFVQPAARADIDSIVGIPPTVAIEQRASRGGLKSTVATLTEIYHFLRSSTSGSAPSIAPTATWPSNRRASRPSPPSCCAGTAARKFNCWRR
jgi:excinuclease ABC subunit A